MSAYWKANQRRLAPWVFLAPGMVMFLIYVIIPIFQSMWLSFYDWDGLGAKTWIGTANYVELFDDEAFTKSLKNNVLWLILFMLAVPIGLFMAIFLNQTVRGIRIYKSLFFFPFVISQVVVGLVFGWFFNSQFGLLNEIIGHFGMEPTALLEGENTATFVVILAGLWPQISYCMILYLTGLTAMNSEVIEAARMDGAKGWNLLWHIILPQLRPATFIAVVVSVVGALRSFDLVSIMTLGGPYNSSTVLAYAMYEQTFLNFRYGYGAAIATILFIIMDVYIAFFLYSMLKREQR